MKKITLLFILCGLSALAGVRGGGTFPIFERDQKFGAAGTLTMNPGYYGDMIFQMAPGPGGIYYVGQKRYGFNETVSYSMGRITSDGMLDPRVEFPPELSKIDPDLALNSTSLVRNPDGTLFYHRLTEDMGSGTLDLCLLNAFGDLVKGFGEKGCAVQARLMDSLNFGIAGRFQDGSLLYSGSRWTHDDTVVKLFRVKSNGELDGSFGKKHVLPFVEGGIDPTEIGYFGAVTKVIPGRGIFVYGTNDKNSVILRIEKHTEKGTLDLSYGKKGVWELFVPNNHGLNTEDIVIDEDGTAYVLFLTNEDNLNFRKHYLAKVLPNGRTDLNFGIRGVVLVSDLENMWGQWGHLALTPSHHVVAVTQRGVGSIGNRRYLTRVSGFNSAGTLLQTLEQDGPSYSSAIESEGYLYLVLDYVGITQVQKYELK